MSLIDFMLNEDSLMKMEQASHAVVDYLAITEDPRSPLAGPSPPRPGLQSRRKSEEECWFVAARIPLQFCENRQTSKTNSKSATKTKTTTTGPQLWTNTPFGGMRKNLAETSTPAEKEKKVVAALLSLTPSEDEAMTRRGFNAWLAGEKQHDLLAYGPGTPDIAHKKHNKLVMPTTLMDLINAIPASPVARPFSPYDNSALGDGGDTPVSPLSLDDGDDDPVSPLSLDDDPETPVSPLSLDDDQDNKDISPLSLDDSNFMSNSPSFIFPKLDAASQEVRELNDIRAQITSKLDDILRISTEAYGVGHHTIRYAVLKLRLSRFNAKIRKLQDRENILIATLLEKASLTSETDKNEDAKSKMSLDSGYQGSDDSISDKYEGRTVKIPREVNRPVQGVELRIKSSALLRGGSIRQKVQCKIMGRVVIGEEDFAERAGF